MADDITIQKFECPRRIERYYGAVSKKSMSDYIDQALDPDGKVFDDKGKLIPTQDYWEDNKSCSYCGSVKPKILFDLIESGEKVIPTDKNYKIYIGKYNYKFYTVHLNRSDSIKFKELLHNNKLIIDYPGYFYNRLYLA